MKVIYYTLFVALIIGCQNTNKAENINTSNTRALSSLSPGQACNDDYESSTSREIINCTFLKEYKGADNLNQKNVSLVRTLSNYCYNDVVKEGLSYITVKDKDDIGHNYFLSAPNMNVSQQPWSSFKENNKVIRVKTKYTGSEWITHLFKYDKRKKTLYIKKTSRNEFKRQYRYEALYQCDS